MNVGTWYYAYVSGPSKSGSANAYDFRIAIKINSQNVSSNTSNITIQHALRGWNFSGFISPKSRVFTDGTQRNEVTVSYNDSSTVYRTWATWTGDISHNAADGKKSLVFLGTFRHHTSAGVYTYLPADNNLSSTYTFPQIIRTFAAPGSITFNTPTYGSNQACSWGSVSGATQYRLEYSRDGGSVWYLETQTASTSYTVSSARFNVMGTIRYRVRVNAKDGWNASSYRTGTNRTIQKASQTAPATPTLVEFTDTTISVNGTDRVRIGTTGTGFVAPHTFTALTPETAYAIYGYKASTTTHLESPNSGALNVTTDASYGGIFVGLEETELVRVGVEEVAEIIYYDQGEHLVWKE